MSHSQLVKELDMAFKRAISSKRDLNTELARSLRSQDRYSLFIDHLAEKWPKYRATRFHLDKETCMDKYAAGMLDILINMKEIQVQRMYETGAEKSARDADVSKVKDMDAALEGKVDNEFADLGIVTDDDSVTEVMRNATEIEEDRFVQE